METINNAKTLLDAGVASAAPNILIEGGIPYVVAPEDYRIKQLEDMLPAPVRKRSKVTTTDTEGFIYYTHKHGKDGNTVIYADIDGESNKFNLVAVLDDHGYKASDAQWREHRCQFEPAQAVEWKRWVGKNKAVFSQAEFATWLEDNLADIATVPNMPTGADILQMALGFEANAEKRLRSKINLQNGGVRFEFVEDEDKDTRASMEVFQRFTLGLPVFEGSSSAYPLEARLKYREKEGKVTFWFELIRPDRVFKEAVDDELNRIKDATGFPVVAGKP